MQLELSKISLNTLCGLVEANKKNVLEASAAVNTIVDEVKLLEMVDMNDEQMRQSACARVGELEVELKALNKRWEGYDRFASSLRIELFRRRAMLGLTPRKETT